MAYKFLKCRLPFVGYRSQLFRISSMDKLKVDVKVVEKTRHVRSFASSSPTSLTKTHVPDCRTKTTVRNHSGEIADVFSNIFVVFALQVMWTTFKWFRRARKAKAFTSLPPLSRIDSPVFWAPKVTDGRMIRTMNMPSWFQLPLCYVIFFLEHICGELS